jgi:hypothetical protein
MLVENSRYDKVLEISKERSTASLETAASSATQTGQQKGRCKLPAQHPEIRFRFENAAYSSNVHSWI